MNLYINEFVKKRYGDPFMSHRFIVDISGEIVASFSQFSGIKMQVQTIQARSGNDIRGVQEYVPVLTSFEPVTLTKGAVYGSGFLDWLAGSAANRFSGPSGKGIRRTIDVIALDDMGNRGVVWTLYDAMPIAYELAPFDAARDEVLTESVTFAFLGMERDFQEINILNNSPAARKPHKNETRKLPETIPMGTHMRVTRVGKHKEE